MDISSPGPSNTNNSQMDIDNDLTSKFLSGQMSFAEYSNEWYNCNDEEEIEDSKLTDSDLQETKQFVEKGLRKSTPRRKCRLSPALQGLMGEANLRFVRGDIEMAEKMCHEIIKQVPNVPEPYQTLAQIYERDPDKSLQFSLLAAHLGPSDANEWLRLAAVSKERSDHKQEMICYTQAIKAEPTRLDLHEMRIALFKHLEDTKYPIYNWSVSLVRCYHKIVSSLPPSEGETIIKYAKMAAKIYHSNNEMEHMLEVMTLAYNKCSSLFTLENLNILLELLIVNKQYQTCLDIFVSKVGVEIEADITTVKNDNNEIEEQINYLNCTIPNNLAIDLKSKLLVCFIHLGAINLVQTLLQDFLSNDVEKAGDLYMDIEEALSAVGHHELAMKLLEPLVKNTSFDLGAVWLKHAECLYNLGRDDDALESYYKVLKHAPQHPEARRKLFTILEKRGCTEQALNILQQDYKYVVSASLLYEHCNILKKYNNMVKYLEVGEALLSKSFVKYRHEEELKICFRTKSATELIYNFRSVRGENLYNEDDLHFDEEDEFKFTRQQEWDFFTELLKVAYEQQNFVVMQRLAFGAATSKALAPYRPSIEFFAFQASILNNDFQNAFRFVREFAQKHPGSRTWNLLSFIMNSIEDMSHGKFLCRLFQKDTHIVKNLFLGNNFLVSGRYLVALKYFLEYHDQCREPFSALLIAITILVMAAQRTVDKHHNLIMQGISYLFTYHQLRKCPKESYYNLGRTYQMLKINNLAIEYYKKALECGPIAVCDKHGTIDLTREIAFNLYLLYKEHSPNMARKYMLKYLVI